METFMSWSTIIEATLLSFGFALWITWMGLRGLFQLMPRLGDAVPMQIAPGQRSGSRSSFPH
jgi:hypothetical protein